MREAPETKIKICGLTRYDDIACVNQAKPDYVGFVFWEKSRRCVDRDRALSLREKMDSDIRAVGVFVDEDESKIIRMLKEGIIDLAQLHGRETEEQIRKIRYETGKPIIKAVRIQNGDEISQWQKTEADYLLLDGGMGSGKTFDWEILTGVNGIKIPFFLAGGLDANNVSEAIGRFHPYAVDVSSKVETDGKKDAEKIQEFVRRVRNEQR